MTAIPGAEYAPILTRTVIDLGPEGGEFKIEREVRWRADVNDPDDQRAIYRLAVDKLSKMALSRMSARLGWKSTPPAGLQWFLIVGDFHSCVIWEGARGAPDRAHATAALCAAVWGPR